MSTRNHKATFEKRLPPLDNFGSEEEGWEHVCDEWVSLEPLSGRELLEAQQVQAQARHKIRLTHSPTAATITTDYRLKIRKPVVVDEDEPESDVNYRVFHIENIVNVREANRELEMMVVEKV